MKTILLPTDFGKHSEKAMEFAIRIAKRSNAKIIITHSFLVSTMDSYVPSDMLHEIYEEEQENTQMALMEYCQKISLNMSDNGFPIQTEIIIKQNLPAFEILHLAEEKNADLVIMGTEGKDQLFGLLGSTTLEVLSSITCPLLVVHENSTVTDFDKIYFALQDMKEGLRSIAQAIPFARMFNGEIFVFHVDRFQDDIKSIKYTWEQKEAYEVLLKGIKAQYSFPKISLHYDVSENIYEKMDEVIKNNRPDIIVLTHTRKNWLENIFHKSVIQYLVKNTSTPLLIVHS